jgi:hypothetical protein
MTDSKGDDAKRTPDCKIGQAGSYLDVACPNLQDVGGGMRGERYRCEVCGESYFLDYDEMK